MKKVVTVICMLMSVLLIGANSYAGSVTLSGTVKEWGTGKLLSGVKVTVNMGHEYAIGYTNSLGVYTIGAPKMHNFCDSKSARAEKIGYFTAYKQIYDGTCCACNPECPPEYGEIACAKKMTVNWTLLKRAGATSSMLRPEALENNGALLLPLFAVYQIINCQHQIGCMEGYECTYQWIVDQLNGWEYNFGRQTRPDIDLPECPDVPNFVDFVNDWLDAAWEYWYGDNFPEDGGEEAINE